MTGPDHLTAHKKRLILGHVDVFAIDIYTRPTSFRAIILLHEIK